MLNHYFYSSHKISMWCPSSCCPLCCCPCHSYHGWSLLLMSDSFLAVLSRLIVVVGTFAVLVVPMLPFLLLTFMFLSLLPCCPPLWDIPGQVDCYFGYTIFLFLSRPCPPLLLPFPPLSLPSFAFHIIAVSFVARYLPLSVGPLSSPHLVDYSFYLYFCAFRCCSPHHCCCC